MIETGILPQWATLEANSGAIFPILRSSRIPQLLGDAAVEEGREETKNDAPDN